MGYYPYAPGHKVGGTSEEAALKVNAATVREAAYQKILQHKDGLTADEVAYLLGEGGLTVRPRVSELLAQGRVEDSGKRRKNASGRSAVVWIAI